MHKPIGRQIANGTFIAAAIILGGFALFALFDGEVRIWQGFQESAPVEWLVEFGELLCVGTLLWFTSTTWARAVHQLPSWLRSRAWSA
jgi:hypothetical protein